jgi:hypothetical protein
MKPGGYEGVKRRKTDVLSPIFMSSLLAGVMAALIGVVRVAVITLLHHDDSTLQVLFVVAVSAALGSHAVDAAWRVGK